MFKGSHKLRNTIIGIALAVALVITGISGYAMNNVKTAAKNVYYPAHTRNSDLKAIKHNKPISMLLMGVNAKGLKGYRGDTDAMMLVTINPKKNTTRIVSVPRNATMKMGRKHLSVNTYRHGPAKSMDSVSKWLNVPVDYFGLMNESGLRDSINKIHGINVTPRRTFKFNGYTFKKNHNMHMYGKAAMMYIAAKGNDSQQRQSQVITAMVKKGAKFGSIFNAGFIKSLSHQVQTNLTFKDLTKLGLHYRNAQSSVHTTNIRARRNGSVTKHQRQKATNFLRRNLGMKHAKVSARY